MICAIMQPTYLPWMGFFDLIDQVDRFVFLDNVKLEKSSWHVRNRIKSANGPIFLTVTVTAPNGRLNTNINDAELDYRKPWPAKHMKSLQMCYQKAKHYDEMSCFIKELLSHDYLQLSELNIHIIKAISDRLGIKTDYFVSSKMQPIAGVNDARLVGICQKLESKQYLSPQGSAAYLEKKTPGGKLVEAGIELFYQNFEHLSYRQRFGEFTSHLSIVDCLMNLGFQDTIDIIRSGRRTKYRYDVFRNAVLGE